MWRILGLIVAIWSAVPAGAGGPALAPGVLRLFQEDSDALRELCEEVIAGYGGPGGLETDGIEAAIGLQRAEARAIWLHRFWTMDLEGDGHIAAAELEVALRAASAGSRARMVRAFEKADLDRDGDVSAKELAAGAAAAGLRRLPEEKATVLRALPAFDADGNGLVSRDEFRRAAAAMPQDDGT